MIGTAASKLAGQATPQPRRIREVESGRNPDRSELGKALHLAKVTGSVRFVAVDLPEANDLTMGIMALVAQQEREAISRRTKEALAVARSRDVRLGYSNGAAALRRAGKGGAPLRAAMRPTPTDMHKNWPRCWTISGRAARPACGRWRRSSTTAAC